MVLLVAACFARAFAAAPVVYVAYNGSDTYPCTRTNPCMTITHSLTVVPPGGVVNIVGSGTYDTFTIAKAVTVQAEPGVVATISVPSFGTGITVNAASTDVVRLKGLTVHGSGPGTGIQISSVARITIEDCVSQSAAYGIAFTGSVAGFLKIAGGSFEGSNTGLYLVNSNLNAAIDRVRVYGGDNHAGIDIDASNVAITHSWVTGEGGEIGPEGVRLYGGTIVLEDDTVSGYYSGVSGYYANSYLSSCTITHNAGYGIVANGANVATSSSMFSRGNNTVVANGLQNELGPLTPFSAQ